MMPSSCRSPGCVWISSFPSLQPRTTGDRCYCRVGLRTPEGDRPLAITAASTHICALSSNAVRTLRESDESNADCRQAVALRRNSLTSDMLGSAVVLAVVRTAQHGERHVTQLGAIALTGFREVDDRPCDQ